MTGLLRHPRTRAVTLHRHGAHQFAAQHALVAYRTGAVFTFIPKNGCTTLRHSLAMANGLIAGPEEFAWIHENNGAFAATLPELVRARVSVVILRCPHARLASAFLDKFVRYEADAWQFRRHLGDRFELSDLTFRDFVTVLSDDDTALRLNIHWRPQIDFLVYEDYALWVALHELSQKSAQIEDMTGVPFHDTRAFARHDVSRLATEEGAFADAPLSELHALRLQGRAPRHRALYDADLADGVAAIYRDDVDLYLEKLGVEGLTFPPRDGAG